MSARRRRTCCVRTLTEASAAPGAADARRNGAGAAGAAEAAAAPGAADARGHGAANAGAGAAGAPESRPAPRGLAYTPRARLLTTLDRIGHLHLQRPVLAAVSGQPPHLGTRVRRLFAAPWLAMRWRFAIATTQGRRWPIT